MFNNFKNSPYVGYKSKQVHNEPTEVNFFQIKHITKIIKIKRHIWLCNKGVKSGANETIGHINKTIWYINKTIQSEELEIINVKTTWNQVVDKEKNLIENGIKY